MTYKECVIVSAYTGYLMCDFDDVHKYIEEVIGGPIWTHELANKKCQEMIHEAVKPDFLALCKHNEETNKMIRITNADRIRQMSDEDMALTINNYFGNCPPWPCPDGECAICWLKWLKQEAKENSND